MPLETPTTEDTSVSQSILDDDASKKGCCDKVYTPRAVLGLFMLMNFLTYYDRGVIAASLTAIKTDSKIAPDGVLSSTESGALVSVFMVGYMISCPLFAMVEKWISPGRIVCIGLMMWVLAVVGCAFAFSYFFLAGSRSLVGIGEAAYAGFVCTMIDDMAPKSRRTLWLGLYFAMIPVGQAAGMAVGGVMSSMTLFGINGWRVSFFTEAIAVGPIILGMLFLPPRYNPKKHNEEDFLITEEQRLRTYPPNNNSSSASSSATAKVHYNPYQALVALVTNAVWTLTTLGYGLFTFVIGGLAVWAITFLQEGPLQMSHGMASISFGLCTATAGLLGTALGGKVLDWIGGSVGLEGARKCHKFNTILIVLATPLSLIAISATNVYAFFALLFVAEIMIFCTSAPVNAATITVVPMNLRTYAMSYSVFVIHLCGDFPSAMVTGALADYFSYGCGDNTVQDACVNATCEWILAQEKDEQSYCVNKLQMRNSLFVVVSMLSVCAALWGAAWAVTSRWITSSREV